MSKKRFFLSLALSVLTGTILLSMNATFASPTETPENSTGVHPTFTGVTVSNGTGGSVELSPLGSITLEPEDGVSGGPVSLGVQEGKMIISSPLQVDQASHFKSINVDGNLNLIGESAISNLGTTNIGTALNRKNLTIIGSLSVGGVTASTSNGVARFGSDNNYFELQPILSGGSQLKWITDNSANDFTLLSSTGNINVGTLLSPNDLTTRGDLTVKGTTTFEGNIDINGTLGTVIVEGPYVSISPTWAASSATCTTGTIIGCNPYSNYTITRVFRSYITGNTCYVGGISATGASATIQARALCLN